MMTSIVKTKRMLLKIIPDDGIWPKINISITHSREPSQFRFMKIGKNRNSLLLPPV